jgi:uncharacterized cupin superfamily protein
MKPAVDTADIAPETKHSVPEPFASILGPYEGRALGDYFGLTQFGAALEILEPNSQSSLRHWHTRSDEFVLVLDGELTLINAEGETLLEPGMCAGFRASVDNAHHLINTSNAPAKYLVIGTRMAGDEVHYPDDDFQWLRNEEGTSYAASKDGVQY